MCFMRARAGRALALCVWLGAWLEPAEGRAQAQQQQWSLALDSGAEYDTNIHRCEGDQQGCPVAAAPLARTTARLSLGWQPQPGRRVQILGFGGARLFADERDRGENLAVLSGDARYAWDLPSRHASMAVRVAYHDTFGHQAPADEDGIARRHFAVANGELHLTLLGGEGHQLSMLGGYRSFRYKPDQDFDWRGDHYGARYRTTVWSTRGSGGDDGGGLAVAAVELSAWYEAERRGYHGQALRNICGPRQTLDPRCLGETNQRRADLSHRAGAEVTYTGDRIYSARYQLDVIDSSSAGPYAQVRHRLEVGTTTELFAGLFATAEAALQVIRYRDALLVVDGAVPEPDPGSDFVAIDDENRNALSLHLARDLGEAWSIEGRYALYTGALAAPDPSFVRQIFYLGVAYRYRP
jgi:hypothetical protein